MIDVVVSLIESFLTAISERLNWEDQKLNLRVKAPVKKSPPGRVIWFTGLSGSGKTTTAEIVTQRLQELNLQVEHLDGDQIRKIFPQTGFSRAERIEHLRRVGFWASRLEAHGIYVVASFITPYEEARTAIRQFCQNFYEIYLSTPLLECERRDAKGLYGEARQGRLPKMTGVGDAFEIPKYSDLVLDTTGVEPGKVADRILALLFSERIR